jgi:hypothetical protein
VFETGLADLRLPAVHEREFPDVDSRYLAASPDPEGAWRMEGLEPGTYVVEVPELLAGVQVHQALRASHRRVVRAPAEDVDLALSYALTHIVPDHPGRAFDGMREVMVSFTDTAGRTTDVHAWFRVEWHPDVGNFSMALAPGEAYRIRVWANEHQPVVLDHVAGAAGQETHLPVRLVRVPCGRLRVDPPPGRKTDHEFVRVELFEPQSGERVHWGGFNPREPRVCEVPEGSWTLRLTTWEGPGGQADDFDLPEVRAIVVTAGAELAIERKPPQGGRFKLLVDRPEGDRGPVACLVERAGTKASPTRLHQGNPHGALQWSDLLESGTPYESSKCFPPEQVTLLIASPGCRPIRLPLRIEPGEVTSARVALERARRAR